jgi:hypothetical protein
MTTITITVSGEELENLNIELTTEEVTALYKLRKEQAVKVADLEKKLASAELSLTHAQDSRNEANNELAQAHTLLSALGVAEKTNEEESYYRKNLTVTTRIALYIAVSKGV